MRVMVFVKATEDSEKGVAPTAEALEAFAAMDRFTEELVEAGVLIAAAGLKPSAVSKRIAFDGPGRPVIDGPFAEARELVAGFSIWEVKDMDEAVAWAKRCPNPMQGPSEIEIRSRPSPKTARSRATHNTRRCTTEPGTSSSLTRTASSSRTIRRSLRPPMAATARMQPRSTRSRPSTRRSSRSPMAA